MAFSVVDAAFRLGFNLHASLRSLVMDLMIDAILAVDITLWFFTSYEDRESGRMVASKKRIALNYLKLWFWIDLVSMIPFELILEAFMNVDQSASASLAFIRLLRFVQLPKLLRALRLGLDLRSSRLFSSTFGVQKVLLQSWFFTHILCCFWYFISTPDADADPEYNWVVNSGLEFAKLRDRYVASFFYIILSIVSVGYGDIHAYVPKEMIISMITMISGAVLFGILVGEATRVFKIINPGDRLYKEKMNELKAYLTEASLSNKKRREVQVELHL
jgi:hypothetical protein